MNYRQTQTAHILAQIASGTMIIDTYDDIIHDQEYLDACM